MARTRRNISNAGIRRPSHIRDRRNQIIAMEELGEFARPRDMNTSRFGNDWDDKPVSGQFEQYSAD